MKARIVVFGAGNIGRSFIAPVFTGGGYEAVFADVAPAVLEALESRNSYTLVDKSDFGEISRQIGPVRGIDARDIEALRRELDGSDICITCVGAGALPSVLKAISSAIADRDKPLDIILAENLKGAGTLVKEAMLAAGFSEDKIAHQIGIVETSIGKMVPIMPPEVSAADPLLSWAEPFNTLIVDKDAFLTPVPQIKDLMAVSPIAPWVARKLYIHNFGHAAAAYLGNYAMPGANYIWEVLEDKAVSDKVEAAMKTSGKALRKEYPGNFSEEEINNHIKDLIARFSNRALGDTVYRVGRDLRRKLHRKDRIVGALALIIKHGLDTGPALEVFKAALTFNALNPEGIADVGDRVIRDAAKDPSSFLKAIIQVDESDEPGLVLALSRVLEESNQGFESSIATNNILPNISGLSKT